MTLNGNHVRTHLMQGGKYWLEGKYPNHPVHGRAFPDGVIHHEVK